MGIMVSGILEDLGRHQTRIICEVLDPRTDRLLARNQGLLGIGTFFRSSALETGMFTMASSEPIVFNTLTRLMLPDFHSLEMIPISAYVDAGGQTVETDEGRADATWVLSFWELHNRVRRWRGRVLIGWQLEVDEPPILCPDINK